MAIYRGSGGAGDATGDATNASVLAVAAAAEAQASATSAASSATNAASSASAAASSETDAGNSATAAATSATDAAASASTASTQATNASNSATSAASSASAASSSASSASSSASAASTSATNAASSASSASTSASSASTSATNASNSASAASTSATNAANSATAAATSEANAAATLANALVKTNNLSDVSSASTARTNLGLAIGTNVQAYSSELQAISSSGNAMFKNRIINGAMMIDQRNAGASVSVANNTATYTTDRWLVYSNNDGFCSMQQVSDAPTGFVKSLKFTTTTADASLSATQRAMIQQRIEGFNAADLGWGTASAATVTISFWVKSSLTGSFGASVQNESVNRAYPFSYTINSANTWEQKTVTIAGDTTGTWATDNTCWARINFGMGVGSTYSGTANAWVASDLNSVTGAVSVIGTLNATWQVTGVQLEKGSTATSFDYRPYGTELALCQRYFTNSNGGKLTAGASSGTAYPNAFFKQSLRANPTVTPTFIAGTGSLTIDAICPDSFRYYNNTGGALYDFSWTASAEL